MVQMNTYNVARLIEFLQMNLNMCNDSYLLFVTLHPITIPLAAMPGIMDIIKLGSGRISYSAGLSGRISGYPARKSRMSGNIRQGMLNNPVSSKKTDSAQP